MKTKIIPFDIETAKKIQEGKTTGLILTRGGQPARIIAFDRKDEKNGYTIIAMVSVTPSYDTLYAYKEDGRFTDKESDCDLVLEVPDPGYDFKPFDRVLVRIKEGDEWNAAFFSHFSKSGDIVTMAGWGFKQCIPYEGNEKLLGTTKDPN